MTQPIRLLQFSDTHLFAEADGELAGENCLANLERVLSHARANGPVDAALITGDLVHDESDAGYARLAQAFAKLNCPCYPLIGNHDDPVALSRHCQPPIHLCREVHLGRWSLLLLDTRVPGSPSGRLGTRQIDWLNERLAALTQRHLILAMHHQPCTIGSPWMDAMRIEDADALAEALAPHPHVRTLLCGHIHQPLDQSWANHRVLGCPATSVQFRPHTQTAEYVGGSAGYRWLELFSDGTLKTGISQLSF